MLSAGAFAPPASALPALATYRTRHYTLHTDLDKDFATDLGRRLDAMYDEYARRLANFVADKPLPPLEVYLFRRQADYLELTHENDKLKNTGGVYMTGRNLLAAFLEGQGRDALRRALQHEAFHQFAHNCISKDLPVWLNEGMAQLFEEGIWTGGEFWLGQVPPRRIRQLQDDLKNGRLVDFDRFMAMSPDLWADRLGLDQRLGTTQYNQAWAMVHFLVHAKDPQTGKEKYRGRLMQMLEAIHAGTPAQQAFEEAFSSNTKGFQSRFVEFARNLKATPEATLIENQGVLADLLTGLKDRGHAYDHMADFHDACVNGKMSVHYTRGQLAWATDPNLDVYFRDLAGHPLSGDRLFFARRRGAALPDIVCRASERFQLRTRFYAQGKGWEYEVLVEPPATQARTTD